MEMGSLPQDMVEQVRLHTIVETYQTNDHLDLKQSIQYSDDFNENCSPVLNLPSTNAGEQGYSHTHSEEHPYFPYEANQPQNHLFQQEDENNHHQGNFLSNSLEEQSSLAPSPPSNLSSQMEMETLPQLNGFPTPLFDYPNFFENQDSTLVPNSQFHCDFMPQLFDNNHFLPPCEIENWSNSSQSSLYFDQPPIIPIAKKEIKKRSKEVSNSKAPTQLVAPARARGRAASGAKGQEPVNPKFLNELGEPSREETKNFENTVTRKIVSALKIQCRDMEKLVSARFPNNKTSMKTIEEFFHEIQTSNNYELYPQEVRIALKGIVMFDLPFYIHSLEKLKSSTINFKYQSSLLPMFENSFNGSIKAVRESMRSQIKNSSDLLDQI